MFWNLIAKILPSRTVYAHCDVPCGIYDPKPAQIAAATMLKMTKLIGELSNEPTTANRNSFVRYVTTKEEHGRILKHELSVLWTDYFKPEHLEKYPDLHDKFWKTMKLVSKVKQTVDEDSANELISAVDEIARIFEETKAATKDAPLRRS